MHDQRHAMAPFWLFRNFAKLRRTARKFHFSQVYRTHIENMAAVTLLRRRASFWWREFLAGGCADWTVVMNGIRKTYLYVYGSQRLLDIRWVYQSAGLKRLTQPFNRVMCNINQIMQVDKKILWCSWKQKLSNLEKDDFGSLAWWRILDVFGSWCTDLHM